MSIKRFQAGNQPVEYRTQSAELAASGIALAGENVFCGLLVKTDGTNNVTITVYDNASAASGDKLLPSAFVVKGTALLWGIELDKGILADNGIYVEITCAGTCSVIALYDQG